MAVLGVSARRVPFLPPGHACPLSLTEYIATPSGEGQSCCAIR
jgi:hypothetical protein